MGIAALPASLPPCHWKPAQSGIGIQISLPISAWHSSWWPVSTWLEEKVPDLRSREIQPVLKPAQNRSIVYKASCLEVGSIFFSTVFIFIKTQITRRQCISNRDLKRKRKGLWEVKLLLQLNSGFYGNKGCFVWLEPLPPPTAPDNVFVWPTFLLLHSSSLPPSVSSNNTHCHRSRKEIKTHSIWAELNHEAGKGPGRWELAFAQRTRAIILFLASCFVPFSSGSWLLVLHSFHA